MIKIIKPELGSRGARIAAYLIDIFLIMFPSLVILSMICYYVEGVIGVTSHSLNSLTTVSGCIIGLAYILYFPVLEASKFQKTIGKHWLGLYVADAENKRLSFSSCFIRYIIFFITAFTGILLVQMLFTRVGMHDYFTYSRVWSKHHSAPGGYDEEQDDED